MKVKLCYSSIENIAYNENSLLQNLPSFLVFFLLKLCFWQAEYEISRGGRARNKLNMETEYAYFPKLIIQFA